MTIRMNVQDQFYREIPLEQSGNKKILLKSLFLRKKVIYRNICQKIKRKL